MLPSPSRERWKVSCWRFGCPPATALFLFAPSDAHQHPARSRAHNHTERARVVMSNPGCAVCRRSAFGGGNFPRGKFRHRRQPRTVDGCDNSLSADRPTATQVILFSWGSGITAAARSIARSQRCTRYSSLIVTGPLKGTPNPFQSAATISRPRFPPQPRQALEVPLGERK